ncbi:MAG: hypothetical protein IJY62_06305 [Clostridia bacterium]|nr:hypothetical protein [Clostridia bacterium]
MSEEDNRPLSEKIEDKLDEVVYKAQNAVYGERKGLNEDIPATMEDPSGFRRINKHATRRNIGRMILRNPKIILIALGIFVGAIVLIAVIT